MSDDKPDDWLASFSDPPDLALPTPEDEVEKAWLLTEDVTFAYHPEGEKILAKRHALQWEREQRAFARMGRAIVLDNCSLTRDEIKVAKAELKREADQDRIYFADKHLPLNEREKTIRAALKAEFMVGRNGQQGQLDD